MRQVIRQLKHDLKDDWYPDSLGYEDTLEAEVISEAIAESLDSNDGLFLPGNRAELNVPKKGFVLRYSLETSLLDRAYYHALVAQLVPFYEQTPSRRLDPSQTDSSTGPRSGRYLFLHPIEQWKLFKGYVAEEARNKPVVLVTHVQN